ncbi:hypothetical protein CHS0354_037799 [Potamilus streckersoni]|uniref:Serine aminopeptidase S33 domain-containing protein n=1 Tax=Potamilus streckersoni TaxID=2493646 RepID=A0AAE0SN85_9BIVA|nr:hypothetical protein CHS0354_037799 [Potamilus streckersoni]
MEVSSEWRFSNKNGKKIFCRCWNEDSALKSTSSGQLKAIVLIVHGFAEHCLWYNELAEFLVQESYLVVAHDHVGHGQSEGDRAHINDFSEYVGDIFQHADMVKKTHPKLPFYLIGHSMGGCLSIMAGLEQPDYFQGMILIAPAIIPDRNAASPFKIFMGKLLARMFPQLPIIKLDSSAVSRDKAVVKKYDDDPLVYHSGLKARWGLAFLSALEKIKMEQENVDWPILNLHGEKDALCDPEGSKMLQEKAKSKDKQLKLYPEAYHQLHNELPDVKDSVYKEIKTWLAERVK